MIDDVANGRGLRGSLTRLKTAAWHLRKRLKRAAAAAGNAIVSPFVRTDVCGVDHYFGTPTGVARHTDLLWQLIERIEGLRVRKVVTRQGLPSGVGKPRVTVWIAQARDLPRAARTLGWLHRSSGRNVGYWSYELDPMPADEISSARLLSEIWVTSELVASSIESSGVPCYVVPPPVLLDGTLRAEARDYGSLNRFLVVLDAYSSVERKNPWTAIRAFDRVFAADPSRTLTVRVVRAAGLTGDLRRRLLAHQSPRVRIVLETFEDVAAAHRDMRRHDVYLSLHRTEGLGFNIVEAILMGIPVVATGYGGNVDFCDPRGVDLVDYELVPGTCTQGIYRGDFVWAEPKLDDACAVLRRLVERSPAETARRAELARRAVVRHFDTERIMTLLSARLAG